MIKKTSFSFEKEVFYDIINKDFLDKDRNDGSFRRKTLCRKVYKEEQEGEGSLRTHFILKAL